MAQGKNRRGRSAEKAGVRKRRKNRLLFLKKKKKWKRRILKDHDDDSEYHRSVCSDRKRRQRKCGSSRRFGEPVVPDFEIPYHTEIMESFDGIDLDSARKVAGNGFYYLMGDIARLHSAVIAYARDFMIDRGFTYCVPPFMITKQCGYRRYEFCGNGRHDV